MIGFPGSVLDAFIIGGLLSAFFGGLSAIVAHQRAKTMRKDLAALLELQRSINEMPDESEKNSIT